VAAGATGILLHRCSTRELFDALRRVARFEQILPSTMGFSSCRIAELEGAEGLTPLERKVMRMLAAGLKRSDIATALNISGWTVDSHRKSAVRKMRAKGAGG